MHWALCKRHGLGRPGSNPLKHHLVPVTENLDMKLLWELNIPTDTQVRHNRPDLVLLSSTQVLLMDVSVSSDQKVPTKIAEKITKYAHLCQELRRIWHVDDVRIVPLVVGALGGLTGASLSHFVLAYTHCRRCVAMVQKWHWMAMPERSRCHRRPQHVFLLCFLDKLFCFALSLLLEGSSL